ncbi:conserved exported protein of unknown function [Denitratisoma oestradiolicum]|uniref:Tll0287-like domain-containing protein n=2 Tax=Denitratisoma oestradiolicum TaxID=311182 RepID=A0A6S6XU95_9PROT|nr:conserved exported protein of unknown function [Denitratisoma oestradiolicum]
MARINSTGFWLLLPVTLLFLMQGATAAEDLRKLTDDARTAAKRLIEQTRTELTRELERSGPARAVTVCKFSVPELASSISRQTGMRVTRVSLRPRNRALGEADPWEQRILLDFEKRLAKGENPETLEISEIMDEPVGKTFRYMKALIIGKPCMGCHGSTSDLSEGVKIQLANEYPFDRGTDYQLGQIRGAISVKRSLQGP